MDYSVISFPHKDKMVESLVCKIIDCHEALRLLAMTKWRIFLFTRL
ncbi:hypothetical protein [Helicobacter rodentium]|nr:hypothetical protein [Helicobacter rodentium]